MNPGDKIDGYTLLHECGRGAFGTVYLAKDDDGKYVALKAVSLWGDAGDRELQALESYKKCGDHDCMMKIYQVVMKEKERFFYYTMEPADGIPTQGSNDYVPCTLEEVLRRNHKLNVGQTTELVSQLLEALSIIHEHGLVHRDIKPANIFWINKRAKLGDIGLLANDNSMTIKAGSPHFIPPSTSCISQNSTAVDLYAMTRLIYCCLSGNSAEEYPSLEPTDDIFNNGRRLLKIMNMPDEKLAQSTVKYFQRVIGSIPTVTTQKIASVAGACSISQASHAKGDSLSSLTTLSDLISAESWITQCGLDKVGAALALGGAAVAGTAIAGGVGSVAGTAIAGASVVGGATALTTGLITAAAPVALPVLGAYLLYKKLSKNKG